MDEPAKKRNRPIIGLLTAKRLIVQNSPPGTRVGDLASAELSKVLAAYAGEVAKRAVIFSRSQGRTGITAEDIQVSKG